MGCHVYECWPLATVTTLDFAQHCDRSPRWSMQGQQRQCKPAMPGAAYTDQLSHSRWCQLGQHWLRACPKLSALSYLVLGSVSRRVSRCRAMTRNKDAERCSCFYGAVLACALAICVTLVGRGRAAAMPLYAGQHYITWPLAPGSLFQTPCNHQLIKLYNYITSFRSSTPQTLKMFGFGKLSPSPNSCTS